MNNLISVIVPIYKVEPYLRQCVDSIINQTYKNLEIILVDDGSPDGCPQICDDYAAKDTRVKVIHKENGGLSSARNAGLDIATGDYIAFVDSDDYLETTMYNDLYELIKSQDADVSVSDIYILKQGKLETYSFKSCKVTVVNNKQDIFCHLIKHNPYVRFEVWNKLFKKSFIGDIRFKVGQIYEDLYFDRSLLLKAPKLVHIEKPLYVYRENRPGSTNSYFKENRFIFFEEFDKYLDLFENWKNDKLIKEYATFVLNVCTLFYIHAKQLGATDNQKHRIIKTFQNYYTRYSTKFAKKPVKFVIFHLSPNAYYVISNTLSLFR